MARYLTRVAMIFLLAAAPLVNSHAVLMDPKPWNANPSTTRYCGGGTPAAVTGSYTEGTISTITWKVVAGDGAGAVSAYISTATASSSFNPNTVSSTTTKLTLVGSTPTTTGTFRFNMTVPTGLTCPQSGCTLQVGTTSWMSCATVNITAKPTTILTTAGCTTASNLVTCNQLNGKSLANQATSFSDVDSSVALTLLQDLPNKNVFTVGNNSAACNSAYTTYLCAKNFPVCGATTTNQGACNSRCNAVRSACVINETHTGLFPCNNIVTADALGSCNAAMTMSATPTVLLGALIMAVLALMH